MCIHYGSPWYSAAAGARGRVRGERGQGVVPAPELQVRACVCMDGLCCVICVLVRIIERREWEWSTHKQPPIPIHLHNKHTYTYPTNNPQPTPHPHIYITNTHTLALHLKRDAATCTTDVARIISEDDEFHAAVADPEARLCDY